MNNKSLHQLYVEHKGKVSDKWTAYLDNYERIFTGYRQKPIRLLEIGIQNGGSLEIWSRFFINANRLLGCDIDPACAKLEFEDKRIALVIGDINSDPIQATVLQYSSVFDIIIDDGSHRSSDIITTFVKYFPHLADDGVFVAEDLHCSYWSEFEGGLFDPLSSISFFKRLADILNYEHWGVEKFRTDILKGFFSKYDVMIDENSLALIHSVEFINSMCVIRKKPVRNNSLGLRFFAGLDGAVESKGTASEEGQVITPTQANNKWSTRAIPPDEEVCRLELAILEVNTELIKLKREVTALVSTRDSMLTSVSWRITEPFRSFGAMLNKFMALLGR